MHSRGAQSDDQVARAALHTARVWTRECIHTFGVVVPVAMAPHADASARLIHPKSARARELGGYNIPPRKRLPAAGAASRAAGEKFCDLGRNSTEF